MPLMAFMLSLLCGPGVGQIYNRQYAKGALILLGFWSVNATIFFVAILTLGLAYIPAIIAWLALAIDALQVGRRLNSGQPVDQWQFFQA